MPGLQKRQECVKDYKWGFRVVLAAASRSSRHPCSLRAYGRLAIEHQTTILDQEP
jgi:hypothetical protein